MIGRDEGEALGIGRRVEAGGQYGELLGHLADVAQDGELGGVGIDEPVEDVEVVLGLLGVAVAAQISEGIAGPPQGLAGFAAATDGVQGHPHVQLAGRFIGPPTERSEDLASHDESLDRVVGPSVVEESDSEVEVAHRSQIRTAVGQEGGPGLAQQGDGGGHIALVVVQHRPVEHAGGGAHRHLGLEVPTLGAVQRPA